MNYLARYLSVALEVPEILKKQKKQENREIHYDEMFNGIRFIVSDESTVRHIKQEQKANHTDAKSQDFYYKKPKEIWCNGEALPGVIRFIKNETYGSYVFVEDDKIIYESIEPVFEYEEDFNQPFKLGDIVKGKYYGPAQIMQYWSAGFYLIQFLDSNETKIVHINSMEPYEPEINIVKNTENNMSVQAEKIATTIAKWIKKVGLGKHSVTTGESKKTNRVYFATKFSYGDGLKGNIQVYGPKFMVVDYDLLGTKSKFVPKSEEEFYDTMNERFGIFLKE